MAEIRPGTLLAGAILALSLSAPVAALTVYDIIRLSDNKYRDDDILALIQATDSAFELKAEDVTRLMELGVSEPVIQAMLKAVPDEAIAAPGHALPPGGAAPAVFSANDHAPVATATAMTGSGAEFAGGHIAYEPFSESGGGSHHHSVVTLAGHRLLILRDEGAFPTVAARAEAVVKRLGQVAGGDTGTFRMVYTPGGDAVMFYRENTKIPTTILNVSHADAKAYQRRSGRTVSPALLAAYWSDLLSDYWTIATNRATPLKLAELHDGEALNALHEQWSASAKAGPVALSEATRLLPRQTQQHLLQLATTVPRDFEAEAPHQQE